MGAGINFLLRWEASHAGIESALAGVATAATTMATTSTATSTNSGNSSGPVSIHRGPVAQGVDIMHHHVVKLSKVGLVCLDGIPGGFEGLVIDSLLEVGVLISSDRGVTLPVRGTS